MEKVHSVAVIEDSIDASERPSMQSQQLKRDAQLQGRLADDICSGGTKTGKCCLSSPQHPDDAELKAWLSKSNLSR